jgi:WhiB family transcriptional regulator, redox-sensing transcriptional regulator
VKLEALWPATAEDLSVELPAFYDQAACRDADPDIFFPEKGEWTRAIEAKAICGSCPVREECLQWALETGQLFGTWGGLGERERRRLRIKLGYAEARWHD